MGADCVASVLGNITPPWTRARVLNVIYDLFVIGEGCGSAPRSVVRVPVAQSYRVGSHCVIRGRFVEEAHDVRSTLSAVAVQRCGLQFD